MKKLIAALFAWFPVVCAISCASVDPAEKYPNMVADMDPVSAGTIDAELDRMFSSKLNKIPVEVIFYPRLNTVALEFRYEFVRYRQFWNEQGRKQFAGALARYKEDYAARTLIDRYGKTRAVYGKLRGRVEWETFKYTTTHQAAPGIELGYRFRQKAPYFAVLQRSAKEDGASSSEANLESLQINMYFTRAQAEELASLFDQDFLLGLVGSRGFKRPADTPADDGYTEGAY
jgi:hypothetical protein